MITKFEKFDFGDGVFWEVTTEQPYFNIICFKLGVPDKRYEKINIKHMNTICIEKCYDETYNNGWQWDQDRKFVANSLKYQGTLTKDDVTEEDIENWKMRNNIKKYNL